jgi:enhancing lycopene biosynthesis protein 2
MLLRRRRGVLKSKGGDGDVVATVAHAVKGGDGEEEEDVDAAAALPHEAAPVGAPSVYFCGGERSVYCCGGAEESKGGGGDAAATVAHAVKGGDGEVEEDVDAAAALPQAVAPVGAPSVYCCGGERSAYC